MTELAPRVTLRQIKEQFRIERHRDFLQIALRMVTTNGLDALTMQSLADELEVGIGTLYRHFPSKDFLIAELQREALDILNTSFRLSQAHLDEHLEASGVTDPALVTLTKAVGAARFWIDAEKVFPQEIDLSRRMFIDPTITLDAEQAGHIVPAALQMLDRARQLLDDAVAAGALRDGPSAQRAVIVIAGTTGVLMTSSLARWDDDLFDGRELSASMVNDLFLGWSADPQKLADVEPRLAELAERGLLVPPVRH